VKNRSNKHRIDCKSRLRREILTSPRLPNTPLVILSLRRAKLNFKGKGSRDTQAKADTYPGRRIETDGQMSLEPVQTYQSHSGMESSRRRGGASPTAGGSSFAPTALGRQICFFPASLPVSNDQFVIS
jgi:hypothetical protein